MQYLDTANLIVRKHPPPVVLSHMLLNRSHPSRLMTCWTGPVILGAAKKQWIGSSKGGRKRCISLAFTEVRVTSQYSTPATSWLTGEVLVDRAFFICGYRRNPAAWFPISEKVLRSYQNSIYSISKICHDIPETYITCKLYVLCTMDRNSRCIKTCAIHRYMDPLSLIYRH